MDRITRRQAMRAAAGAAAAMTLGAPAVRLALFSTSAYAKPAETCAGLAIAAVLPLMALRYLSQCRASLVAIGV
jgi:hypothetical protein